MSLGNLDLIQELVKNTNINQANNVGDTALIRASETGKW